MSGSPQTPGIKRIKSWWIGVLVAILIGAVAWRFLPPLFDMPPPKPVFVLPDHEIYIVNTSSNRILMFSFDEGTGQVSTMPTRSIEGPSTHLNHPVAAAIDDARRICVVNIGDGLEGLGATLTAYTADATDDAAPLREIRLDEIGNPTGIAFMNTPTRLVVSALSKVPFRAGSLTLFDTDPANSAPLASLGGQTSTLGLTRHITVDPSQSIVVTEPEINAVKSFLVPTMLDAAYAPQTVLTGNQTELDGPADVGFDNLGNMYVTDIGPRLRASDSSPASIVVFNLGANGNTASVRRIGGLQSTHTNLFAPGGLAVNHLGHLFVSDANQLLVFAPGANGDVSPSQIVTNSKLNDPAGGVAYR
jgi:hypothetical protein